MFMPLVSFITPTYNQEKYIADCISSALSQTYSNWEMIIIDDGSTDRTPQIIKSFSDKRIRYFRQDNLGGYNLGVTYNRALKESKGELLAILEGDDFVPADKLKTQVPYFLDKNVILTYGECIMTNESGKPVIYKKLMGDEYTGSLGSLQVRNNHPIGSALQEFVKYNFIFSQTVMIRKDALIKIGGFIQHHHLPFVDYSTWCHLSLEGEFRGAPHLLGYFRRRFTSISSVSLVHKRQEIIHLISDFLKEYSGKITSLGLNIQKLHQIQNDFIVKSNKTRGCHEGISFLILGMHHIAKNRFFAYLKQRDKSTLLNIISLLGMLCSITKVDFSGIYSYFKYPINKIYRIVKKI